MMVYKGNEGGINLDKLSRLLARGPTPALPGHTPTASLRRSRRPRRGAAGLAAAQGCRLGFKARYKLTCIWMHLTRMVLQSVQRAGTPE